MVERLTGGGVILPPRFPFVEARREQDGRHFAAVRMGPQRRDLVVVQGKPGAPPMSDERAIDIAQLARGGRL